MKHWEFLIQKEGDRSWLPLDSPDVEILEGRYRMVVRSHWLNTDVQVRISHLVTEETPPRRRLQKRISRTNPDGLMVVIPFTTLEPGIWEFQCLSSDLMSDLLSAPGQSSVQLHVSPREVEEEVWEPDWQAPAAEPEPESPTPLASAVETEAGNQAMAEAAPPIVEPELPQLTTTPAATLEGVPPITTPPEVPEFVASETVESAVPSIAPPEQPLSSPVIPLSTADAANLGPIPWFPVQGTAASVEPTSEPISEPSSSTEPAVPNPELNPILSASREELIQLTEQLSEQIVAEVMQDFDFLDDPGEAVDALAAKTAFPVPETPLAAINPSSDWASDSVISPTLDPAIAVLLEQTLQTCTYTLTLDQEAFIASRGEEVTLSGRVDLEVSGTSADHSPSINQSINDRWQAQAQLNAIGFAVQELQLCLRDPQSSQILVSDRQACVGYLPPFSFSVTFTLPQETTTRLVLGEVMLCGSLTVPYASPQVLANQAFTVTVDAKALVNELTRLNEMLTGEPEETELESPAQLSHRIAREEATPSLELSFLQPTEEVAVPKPAGMTFLAGQPLPPQIYRPDPDQPRNRALELPTFFSPAPIAPESEEAEPEEQLAPVDTAEAVIATKAAQAEETEEMEKTAVESPAPLGFTLEDANAIVLSQDALQDASQDIPGEVEETPAATEAAVNEAETSIAPDATGEPAEEPSSRNPLASIQTAFQSLRLQDRFLSRLSSLASAGQGDRAPDPSLAIVPAPHRSTPLTPDSELLAHEIVVDDEFPLSPRDRRRAAPQKPTAVVEPALPNPLMLPDDEPVPIPDLQITSGDLVAGKLVNVRVRLPDLLPRIYVKLWLNDRQTRTLLDGPRWLVDFSPNGRGALEAQTQIMVPFGSLEVRFEAIAVEMHTQRESHKAVVERGVVPPDLPVLSLDDLVT